MWPFARKPVQPIQVKLIERSVFKLTLEEFRADVRLVNETRKILNDPHFQLMLQVLNNSHPAWNVLPIGCNNETRSAIQSQIEGYTLCLGNLEAMGKQQNMPEPLVATFEPEETPQRT